MIRLIDYANNPIWVRIDCINTIQADNVKKMIDEVSQE